MINQTHKNVLLIAIPATLEALFVVLITMLDTQMVSPLGTTAISGVAVASQPKLLLFLVFTSLGTAATIVISQAFGEENRHKANAVLVFSLIIALVGSIVLGALAAIFAWPTMIICSGQEDTMAMSVIFLRILMVGMVFQALSTIMNASLRGLGDIKATLLSSVTMGVVDIIFNFLLIEGNLGFPAWGVAGAALATTLGNIAGFAVSLGFLLRKDCFLSLRYCAKNNMRISKEDARELGGKMGNIFCEGILTRIGFLFSAMVVARLGSYETSIYSVGAQLLTLSFAFGDGLQAAILALVGKSVGKQDSAQVGTYIRTSVRIGFVVSIVVALCCALFGKPFFSLFSDNPNFIEEGGIVALFVTAVVPFQIVRIIRASVLRAFGDTKTPRRIATISVLILDPPLSLLFALVLGMGQWGLWLGTLISQIMWFAMAEVASRKALKRFQTEGMHYIEEQNAGKGASRENIQIM